MLSTVGMNIELSVPYDQMVDTLVWEPTINGVVTVKGAYNHYKDKGIKVSWFKMIWQRCIPPKINIFLWKIITTGYQQRTMRTKEESS